MKRRSMGDFNHFLDKKDNEVDEDGKSLRVGPSCATEKDNRLVVVKELAKQSWSGWQMNVDHGDISKRRGDG